MNLKFPRNTEKYYWTQHAIMKMRFYGLSEQKVLGIIRRPQRKEEGIVKNTVAVMRPISAKKNEQGKDLWKSEVWAMYQIKSKIKEKKPKNKTLSSDIASFQKCLHSDQVKIISAWRYPGVSPEKNPIPEEILREALESSQKFEK